MLPSANDLQYFIEIASTLNISRAAERLGVSQPSLSLAIQRLEDTVGVSLLVRSKSGVQLTRAGHRLLAQTRNLLGEWDKIVEDARREEQEVRGRFTLGCHASVGVYALPTVCTGLMKEHPGLEIRLDHDLSRRITEKVISFKVDFGIVINPTEHPDLVIKKLGQDEVKLWRAQNPTPQQDPTSGEGVLIYDPDLHQSQHLLREFAKKRWQFGRYITSSSLEVIAALTAAGAGAGILPGRVAANYAGSTVAPYERGGPAFKDVIALVYRADMQKSVAAKTIVSALSTVLQGT